MDNTYWNIEHIFEDSFSNYHMDNTERNWNKISGRVKRHNFTKFGLTHFNMYHVILFAIAGFSVYLSFTQQKFNEVPLKENTIKIEPLPAEKQSEQPVNKNANEKINITPAEIVIRKEKPEIQRKSEQKTLKIEVKSEVNQSKQKQMVEETSSQIKSSSDSQIPDNSGHNEMIIDTTSVLNEVVGTSLRKKKIKKIVVVVENPVVINDTVVYIKK